MVAEEEYHLLADNYGLQSNFDNIHRDKFPYKKKWKDMGHQVFILYLLEF